LNQLVKLCIILVIIFAIRHLLVFVIIVASIILEKTD